MQGIHRLLQTRSIRHREGDSIYRRLSILTQFLYSPSILFDVSPTCFQPPPEVDSSFIQLTPHYQERYAQLSMMNSPLHNDLEMSKNELCDYINELNDFLRLLFLRKNRNVKTNLTQKHSIQQQYIQGDIDQLKAILEELSLSV